MTEHNEALPLIQELVARATRAGADAADAVAHLGASISHARRLGKTEELEREEVRGLGLRVLVGQRQAIVSSNDWNSDILDRLVERAIAMAKAVPEDPFCGLGDPDQIIATALPSLDLLDDEEPGAQTLMARAEAAEDAALSVNGITNSNGAQASWGRTDIALAASNGFSGTYARSGHGVSVAVIAGESADMETGYDYSSVLHGADLVPSEEIGHSAAEWALKKLNPRKPKTAQIPVVFDPKVSGSLVGHLASAINGSAIARGTSFLKDCLGTQIMAPAVTIIDDPHRIRGLASKPFDAEGLAGAQRELVGDGILNGWVLDLRTARQLGLESTGNASRGVGGPPGPSTSNLHMVAGTLSPEELISDIESGFLVTQMMGSSISMTTGDYSRGASGFWIEKGEIAYPVNEITIAGNLKSMFLNMAPANDLTFKNAVNAPTIRIDGMTLAGS